MCVGLWGKVKLPRMQNRPVLMLSQLCIILVSALYWYVCLGIDQLPVVHYSHLPSVGDALQNRFPEWPQLTQ